MYTLGVQNTGNVTLSDYSVVDPALGLLVCDAAPISPGATAICSGTYTITQPTLMQATWSTPQIRRPHPPSGPDVTDSAIATTLLDQEPTIAVAKSSHVETLGDGTFSTTYLIDVENTGNTTLTAIQVEDDLAAVFGVGTFTVISVSSADLTLDAAYDGHIDTNVLSGTDSLAPGETGAVTLVVLVDPNGEPGPFTNTASVSGGTFDVLASAVWAGAGYV